MLTQNVSGAHAVAFHYFFYQIYILLQQPAFLVDPDHLPPDPFFVLRRAEANRKLGLITCLGKHRVLCPRWGLASRPQLGPYVSHSFLCKFLRCLPAERDCVVVVALALLLLLTWRMIQHPQAKDIHARPRVGI